MMYHFMTLPDNTEVVYSNIFKQNEKECVKVYYERWSEERNAFDSMECILPNGQMQNIVGFTTDEANYQYEKLIQMIDIVMESAREDDAKCINREGER